MSRPRRTRRVGHDVRGSTGRRRPGGRRGSAGSGDSQAPAPTHSGWIRWALLAAVVVISFLAFWPALGNQFVNWDDDANFLENYGYRGFGAEQLRWMFTQPMIGHYHPLTWITSAVDYSIWGLNPFGYHLGNLVLHALNAAWFYVLALILLPMVLPAVDRRGGFAVPLGAAVAALLFGVHPLRVESVAWATERRDVLSTFFLLPCLICYLRHARSASGRRKWYLASVGLLLLSLLSKAWGITLPMVLLVLDFHPLRRLHWRWPDLISPQSLRVYLEKVPFALLAAGAAYKAAWAQASAPDTMRSLEEYGVIQRIAQASYGLAFYLWKTLIPARLIPVYEIPVEMNAFESRFILAAAAVVAITVALLVLRKRWPSGLALWLVYVITVSPVLGLAQSGPQLVADRYSYISCMTWSLLCGAGLAWCLRRQGERQAAPTALPAIVISVLAILTLAALTWRQTLIWRTSFRLWNHTLAVAPDCYTAHGNLGVLLKQQGDLEGALAHYRRSWEIKPDDPQTLNNIGSICQRQGKLEEALEYYERAREIRPDALLVQVNIANCYRQLKRYEEALRILREVVQRERFNYRALTGLGQTLIAVGDPDQAIFYFRQAIEVKDTYAYAHAGLGTAHRMKEEWPKAIQALSEAARLTERAAIRNPEAPERNLYLDACSNLGRAYASNGQADTALRFHQRALELAPSRLFDLMWMGHLLMERKRYDQASDFYRRALKAHPNQPDIREALDRALEAGGRRD